MAEIEFVSLGVGNDHRSRGDGGRLIGAAEAAEGRDTKSLLEFSCCLIKAGLGEIGGGGAEGVTGDFAVRIGIFAEEEFRWTDPSKLLQKPFLGFTAGHFGDHKLTG